MWFLEKIFKKRAEEKIDFEKLANEWLSYKRNTIKESTYCNYMSIIENYLKPEFKNLNFSEVINYNEYILTLSKRLSAKTIRDIIAVLKAILKYYEEEYNQVLKIKRSSIPKASKNTVKTLSESERKKLENYCLKSKDLKMLGIVICLNTGLRIGEICALKWENIKLEERKIYITNTIERMYNKRARTSKLFIGLPKTEHSIRSIPISNKLYEILLSLKERYEKECFLLTGNVKPLEPRRYQYIFKEILKKIEIDDYKFHALRHTFATNCIEVGMDIKSLSEILGHADAKITLSIYVHSSDKMKKKYLEKL